MDDIRTLPSPWQLRVYPFFTLVGWILIALSLLVGLFVLTPTATGYWGANSKGARDAAETGSAPLTQLQTLQVTPRWLEPLTFFGVGAFMVGIALEFSSIPKILANRGQVMRVCFPIIARSSADSNEQ
jgi:hypothetical protein